MLILIFRPSVVVSVWVVVATSRFAALGKVAELMNVEAVLARLDVVDPGIDFARLFPNLGELSPALDRTDFISKNAHRVVRCHLLN